MTSQCDEHSGVCKAVETLEQTVVTHGAKLDAIFSRLNLSLGGIAVSCILLAINLLVKL